MEVTGLSTVPVEVPVKPLAEPFGVAPYVASPSLAHLPEDLSFEEALAATEEGTTATRKLLVRLETDVGVTGWSEISPHRATMRVGRVIFEDMVEPLVVGRELTDIGSLFDAFPRYPHAYYRDITPFLGAAEIAMWDALGKALDQPVHALLGGKRQETVPISFCLGLLDLEQSREKARFARDEGFSVLKTKGSRYWETDVERITAMHEAVDGDLEFRLDPNQLWSVDQAVRVGARLEERGIYLQYLEQPVRVDSIGTLKRLRERLKTPVAGGNEDMFKPHNLFLLAREDAIDAADPDVISSGGITGVRREAGVAAEANISLAHHSNFDFGFKNAAKLHVMSTTPAFNLATDSVYYALEDDFLETRLEITDGEMVVPDRPGLAGDVDEGTVEEYRIEE